MAWMKLQLTRRREYLMNNGASPVEVRRERLTNYGASADPSRRKAEA